jgi:hypothetical protein
MKMKTSRIDILGEMDRFLIEVRDRAGFTEDGSDYTNEAVTWAFTEVLKLLRSEEGAAEVLMRAQLRESDIEMEAQDRSDLIYREGLKAAADGGDVPF